MTLFPALGVSALVARRDKRFYYRYRALWNFALRENLQELDIEFNGVDFGQSNRGERENSDPSVHLFMSWTVLNPNEEAIAPTYIKFVWKVQNT